MGINFDEEEERVPFSIALDGETIDRLMRLSDACHADPRKVAASLLHDLLKDDEFENDVTEAAEQARTARKHQVN
jgi:predicted transcriptional regulator